jgi:hypothetical protein
MNLFAHAEGYSLMMHGLRQRATGTSVAIPLLQQAIEKFEEALDNSFYSKVILRDCASCLLHLHGEHVAAQHTGVDKNQSPLLERANLYYQNAIKRKLQQLPQLFSLPPSCSYLSEIHSSGSQ